MKYQTVHFYYNVTDWIYCMNTVIYFEHFKNINIRWVKKWIITVASFVCFILHQFPGELFNWSGSHSSTAPMRSQNILQPSSKRLTCKFPFKIIVDVQKRSLHQMLYFPAESVLRNWQHCVLKSKKLHDKIINMPFEFLWGKYSASNFSCKTF